MNALCFKTVFSKRLGALVAVGEHATSQSKGQGAASGAGHLGSVLRYVGVLTTGFAAASMAWSQTLPQGGRVSQGQVTIQQSGQQMAITQGTSKAVVNWDSFDIGTNAKVNVVQPSSQSVLLNRVLSDNPTQILGQLQANGQVVLVNPKGIVVGSDGSVSASAFTASTLNISDADFMAGNARYHREGSTGEVINRGRIQTAPGGYVALLGARVSNEGQIVAPQGAVALGAAETVSVPIGRTGKIKLELSPASINTSVANQKGGLIVAEGGQVYMQAAAIPSALASIVHSGHIDTSAAQAGEVHLLADGGRIRVDGQITANSSGRDPQKRPLPGGDIYIGRDKDTNVLAAVGDVSGAQLESKGGFVETSGQYLNTTGTRVLAKDWLLDPTNIIIASSAPSGDDYGDNDSGTAGVQFNPSTDSTILASDIATNLNDGTNVTIATSTNGTDAGDITVSSNISKTSGGAASLTLTAHNIILNAGISSSTGTLGLTLNAAGTGGISGNASGTINTNGGVLTLNTTNAAANGSLGGVISGAGAVTKTGSGNTTLTAANSYSGATTVSGGTLQIGSGGTAGTLGTGTVTNNATLTFNRSNNLTVANTITGTGGLTQSGTGTTTLTGNNSYGGGTTINAGTVASTDSSTALGTGAVSVNANGTLALRTTGTNQPRVSNVLNGSGNITYAGTANNQMFLSGEMSAFSGSFSINGTGTYIWFNNEGSQQARFVVNTGTVMGLWSRTTVSGVATGGVINGEQTFHAGSLTGSGKIQSDGGGASKQVSLSIGALNQTETLSSVIENTYSGGGNVVISLAKVGTGTQTLTGANTYTGTTTIESGTLQIGSVSTSGSLGTGAVTNNAMLTFNRSNNITVGNLISGSGGLTQLGGGTTTLTAANTFTGTTLVSGGTLALGNVNALQNSTLNTGTSGAQQVTFTVGGANTYNIGALEGADNLAIGANSISVGSNSASTNYSGVLSGTGNFSKVSTGTQILSGNNSYSGTTTVSGGTLQVGNAGSIGTLGTGDVTLSNNANLHVLRAADTTLSNTISGAGHVSASITGTVSDLSVTGPMNLTDGTVNLVADGNLSVQQAIDTTNATDSAIVLTAGKPTDAGTSSGGDVSMSGSGSLSTGAGGRATIYTGSLSGSTGLGITTGNNRYNSDESSTNYSAALGSGTYAIYREKPTITVRVNDASKTYDGVAFSGGSLNTTLSSGALVRSDSFSAVTANAVFGGASQSAKNAGQYASAITASETGGKNALGYEVTYTSGQLTINQADLTVTANSVTKTYDGNTSMGTVTVTGTVGTLAGAAAGDVVNNAGSQAFLDSSAGSNKTVRASGVTIQNSANADMTGNYNITYIDNSTSTISKKDVTLQSITAAHKTYDGNTTATISAGVISDTVGSETLFITGSGTFDNKNVADGKTVTVSDVTTLTKTDGTGSWSNYNLTTTGAKTTTANISKKNVTLDSITAANKTYDGSTSATITSGSISGTVLSETLAISGSGTFDNKNVANNKTVTVSDVTSLTKTDGSGAWSNYNLTTTGAMTASANITKKTVTLSGITAANKTYDGNTDAVVSVTNAVFTDKVNGDTLTVTSTGSFANKDAGNSKTVNLSNTLGGADLSNYTVTDQTNTTANIAKKEVTLSSITAANKTYDGSTSATITSGSISGTVLSETLAISGSGTFDNKNAADGKTVTVSDVTTLTQADGSGSWSNYNLTTTGAMTASANISKKDVTLSSITAANKTYDGSTSATITSGSISGTVLSETLAISGSGTFDNKNAANGKTVTVSDVTTLTQADGSGSWSNYTLTTTGAITTTANIAKADLTVTANSVTKTYDGTTNASGTGTVGTLAGAAAGDLVDSAGSQAFLTSGAGNNKTVRASGVTLKDGVNADMTGNYNITYTDNTTGVIEKAELTVTANDDARFVGLTDTSGYNGVSPSGLVNGEDMSVLGGTLSITRTNASTLAAGEYAEVLSPAGLTSDNYNITFAKGTYTIVPANQLLIRNSNISSTYGSTWSYDPTAKYLDGSDNTIVTLSRTGSGNSFTFSDGLGTTVSTTLNPYSGTSVASTSNAGHTVVGSYKIKDASPTKVGSNFVGDPVFVGTLNVNTKALTPSTTGVSMVYNGTRAMSNLSMDVTGKVGTDAVSIQGTGTYSQKHVGTHLDFTVANLALGGADAANYHIQGGVSSITGNDGTITPATLKLSASNVSKTYDGNTSASGTAVATQNTQLFGNDSLSGGTFAFTNPNASSGDKVVQVSGVTVNDGNSGQNYSVSYVDNTTSTITKKEVTLSSLTAANKTYDGSTSATITSGSISGTVLSETLAISGSGTFDNKNAADGKTVTVSDVTTLTQTDGTGSWSNYSLATGSKTTTANIAKKAVTLSGITAENKTYDGNTVAVVSVNNAVFSDKVNGDTLTVASTGSFADKNAGDNKTVNLSNTLGGTDLGNYTVTEQTTTTANIHKKSLTITGLSAVNKVYDGTTQASISSENAVFSGLISGDSVNLAATGTFDTRHVGDNKVVSLSSSLQGADAGNYNATASSDLRARITPASLTVRAPTVVKTYDGTTGAPGTATVVGTLAGASAGDTFDSAALSFTDKNAGTYKTVTAQSALIKDGTGADVTGNYTITYLHNTQSQITPAAASVTARPERVTYNGQTQQQSAAVLEGFVAGDDIQVSGLASGRNAGVYGSNVLASGQDVPNYSISYQQGALTIDKAPLQFVGTAVADKMYDGNTHARVTAGTLSGLVGTETLSIDSVQGQFNSPEMGMAKPVQVVYGLSDGANGGLVSNYQWSPVTVQANITDSATENAPAPERIRQVNPFSRLSYLGFGGLVRTGAATGQLFYALQNNDTRTCSPLQLEGCICEQAQEQTQEQSIQVCYPAELGRQASHSQ